jgi:2-polyprenyl-3-methyl-5-hydroxy-6-metoxy-1,4-benzoquinol methylase
MMDTRRVIDEEDLQERLAQYKFYHVIQLAEGISTPGDRRHLPAQRLVLEDLRNLDLRGKRVLDVGCRDGLFSFEAERMGSSEVIGIDNDLSRPAVEFLIPFFGSAVKMVEMNLFDLDADTFGLFDVVIFAGVLYHLRYPFWALRILRDVLREGGQLLIETAIWHGDRHHAMLYCPTGAESPYEPTSCTFFNEKGMVDSLQSIGFHVDSIKYLLAQPSPSALAGRSKRIARALLKRVRGARVKANIDRAVFVCHVSEENQDELVRRYWNRLHDVHSKLD